MKLSQLKTNPGNPRLIRDEKFKKLVKSIETFPKMLELRPIVYNPETMEILGGNMRLKALQELKYKEIPDNWIKSAESLTEEEKKRFIIEDNVGFGEWDFDILANEWEAIELEEWGVDIPNFAAGLDENNMTDEDVNLEQEFNEIKNPDLLRVVFIFDGKNEAESYLKSINITDCKKQGSAWQVNMSSQFI